MAANRKRVGGVEGILMLVKFTRTIEGGEKRGYVAGREFDWPMTLIRKMRADYGQDILEMSGANGAWIERTNARRASKGLDKPSRQDRLRDRGFVVGKSDGELQGSLADALAEVSNQAPEIEDNAPKIEDDAPKLTDVEPGMEAPIVRRRGRPRLVKDPGPEIPVG